jgi:predicted site-specific integrase-resolvase
MKLSDYAKKKGVHYQTAHRWFKAGKIPNAVQEEETGTIFVLDPTEQDIMDELKKTNKFLKAVVDLLQDIKFKLN